MKKAHNVTLWVTLEDGKTHAAPEVHCYPAFYWDRYEFVVHRTYFTGKPERGAKTKRAWTVTNTDTGLHCAQDRTRRAAIDTAVERLKKQPPAAVQNAIDRGSWVRRNESTILEALAA